MDFKQLFLHFFFVNCALKTPVSMNDLNEENNLSSAVYDLPEEALNAIRKNLDTNTYKKNEVFIKKGELQDKFFFLTSGIARAYVVDKNGKEFTRSLFTPPIAIMSLKAVTTKSENSVNYDCLTDCEMFSGNFEDFMKLTKTNIAISNVYSRMLEKAYLRLEERVYELTLNAVDKYEKLKEHIPDIDNLIPQYQIASYLNITNVQLSRIRKKMLEK